MGKTYLVNAFSLNMIKEFPATITIDKIDKEEFCETLDIRLENGEVVNAVGHDSTVYLINKLCGVNLEKNRINVKMNKEDIALIIMISQRLEEGKVLSDKEIEDMYRQGKISFYEVWL
jgi:hypothetical protein